MSPDAARDAYAEAAALAKVPVREFKLWLIEHMDPDEYNPKVWSHWRTGYRPIPAEYVVAFLQEQFEKAQRDDAARSDVVATRLDEILEKVAGVPEMRELLQRFNGPPPGADAGESRDQASQGNPSGKTAPPRRQGRGAR